MKHLSGKVVVSAGSSRTGIDIDDAPAEARMLHLVSRSAPFLNYYLYIPRDRSGEGRVLVTVHGISRNAREQIDLFRRQADDYGVILIAPVFSRETFNDYQRLGRKGRGPRADLALIRELNSVAVQLGVDTSRVDMFGFSGGAQFAHRFAFAHPQRVGRLVLGAAGWYTMPDKTAAYPLGIGDARGLDPVSFNAAAISRLRTLVVVGKNDDCTDDDELNRSKSVLSVQGENRVQRARTWVESMNVLAGKYAGPGSVELSLLPGVGHSFSQAISDGRLAEHVFEFCYGGQGSDRQNSAYLIEAGDRRFGLSDHRP